MSCANICSNCVHQEHHDKVEGHCYMFRNEPDGQCMQFKFNSEIQGQFDGTEESVNLLKRLIRKVESK